MACVHRPSIDGNTIHNQNDIKCKFCTICTLLYSVHCTRYSNNVHSIKIQCMHCKADEISNSQRISFPRSALLPHRRCLHTIAEVNTTDTRWQCRERPTQDTQANRRCCNRRREANSRMVCKHLQTFSHSNSFERRVSLRELDNNFLTM